jgi:RNA polymerase sigma-70 factor (ECF subfamily)
VIHARNEPGRFKTAALALVPPIRSDNDLIRAAKAGDHDAFAELCRRHTRTARQRILSIVRHQEDAEDAMQETLLRAYSNLGRFRQSCKFSTWITAIGINVAFGVLRKRKSRRESDIEPFRPDGLSWDIPDHALDPERRVAEAQIIFLLRRELQTLPPKLHDVVATYYDSEHSLHEAADALGISLPAAKSRLIRGRRSLRSSLERKGLLDSCV